MVRWWDKEDPRELTVLERNHAPLSFSDIRQLRNNAPPQYKYFDTPDGQDIWKKMWVSVKWGISIGGIQALIDNRVYSNPATVFQTVNRGLYFIVPITSMFATFTAVTYTSTNLRGKDGPINHLIGGAVAGSLAGVWLKSGSVGFAAALIGGVFAMCKKYNNQIGLEIFAQPRKLSMEYGDWRSPFMDYTLTSMGERGWTTGKE